MGVCVCVSTVSSSADYMECDRRWELMLMCQPAADVSVPRLSKLFLMEGLILILHVKAKGKIIKFPESVRSWEILYIQDIRS